MKTILKFTEEEVLKEAWKRNGLKLLQAYWQSQDKFEEVLLKLIEKK